MPASYRFERCLGKGGFGEVYLATRTGDSDLQTQVAVKLMHRSLPAAAQALERLRDEARALAGLNHPNILSIRELTMLDGRVALVTEYVDGQDLRDVARGGMPAPAALEACAGIGAALAEAWEKLEVIHRDVKPQNIRVGRAGQVRLLDFGIAYAHGLEREAQTATDLMVGSHGYTAPERYTGEAVGPASDVFSLGVTTLEALSRGRRFLPSDPTRLVGLLLVPERYEAHLDQALEGIDDRDLRGLLAEALAYSPDARPTAADFARRARRLARRMEGDGLLAFCESHPWPDSSSEPAELVGAELSEGTLAHEVLPTLPSPPMTSASTGSSTTRTVAIAALGLPVVFTGVLVFGAALVWVGMRAQTDSLGAPPVEEEMPERSPSATPSASAPTTPEPAMSEPARQPPAAPVPTAAAEPKSPEPVPASPQPPKAEPVPVAPALAPATVTVESDVRVELRGADGATFKPGEVPPGTYDLIAAWPLNARKALTLDLEEGQRVEVRCVADLQRCIQQ